MLPSSTKKNKSGTAAKVLAGGGAGLLEGAARIHERQRALDCSLREAELLERVNTLQLEVSELQKYKIEQSINENIVKCTEKDAEIHDLKRQLTNLEETLQIQQTKALTGSPSPRLCDALEVQLRERDASIREHMNRYAALGKQHSQTLDELTQLQRVHNKLKREHSLFLRAGKQRELAKLKAEKAVTSLELQLKEIVKNKKDLRERIDELTDQLESKNIEASACNEKLRQVQETLAALETSCGEADAAHKRVLNTTKQHSDTLERALAVKTEKLAQFEERHRASRLKIDQCEVRLRELTQAKNKLQQQIS